MYSGFQTAQIVLGYETGDQLMQALGARRRPLAARRPAELRGSDHEAGHAPGGDHGEVAAGDPGALVAGSKATRSASNSGLTGNTLATSSIPWGSARPARRCPR